MMIKHDVHRDNKSKRCPRPRSVASISPTSSLINNLRSAVAANFDPS
jgi:hypothetical protein